MNHRTAAFISITVIVGGSLVSACSGSSTPNTSATTSTTATTVAVSPIQVTWCKLTLGESKTDVLVGMGAPHGNKAASSPFVKDLSNGQDFAEWDVGQDIFLVTFVNGQASNLQAYHGVVGPTGASDIACPAFRNHSNTP
jgi:hypothetical protein